MSALPFKGQSPMNPTPWGGGGMFGRMGGMMGFPGMGGGGRGFPPMGVPQRGNLPFKGGWSQQQGPVMGPNFNPRAGGQQRFVDGPGPRPGGYGQQQPQAIQENWGRNRLRPMGGGWNQMRGQMPPFMQQKMGQMGGQQMSPQFGQQPMNPQGQDQAVQEMGQMGQQYRSPMQGGGNQPPWMQSMQGGMRPQMQGPQGQSPNQMGMMGPSQGGFGQMLQNMQMRRQQPQQQQPVGAEY